MTDARATTLSRIRAALGRADGSAGAPDERAFAGPVRPAIPEKDPRARFVAKLEAVAGAVVRVAGLARVPEVVLRYLERHGLPHRLVASRDPILAAIPWPEGITLRHGPARDGDRVSITGAFAAVAETGSLVLCAGEDTPTTLNFLPEDHIVVLGADRIVPYMEDVWPLIEAAFLAWPRTVNFITGPSRTGDIEQTMQLGAHGPRRLLVILLNS
uniref:L-lactate dehydrogenase complex protein LldG n=1 Tax=Candidatus Kentrum eta TaxID=2126337 RepID=A0A450VP54_9GAMM|nr:MAG: L-lactate dehydrogenase complex protein LldG [Candidatus Kentron sp. H]VFK03831.1 MAG: L-lactate dehydrogenase complex protein LldG [Candidatus Kentron sp. H]VFK06551.1 MAG: L-lactate dehydrogenase complex protein LldG [Candidatus Kentron sp. H]